MSRWKPFTLAPEPATPVIASGKVETALTAAAVSGGAPFRIPLLVPEGVPTGDGRTFSPLSLRTRDLPLPLLWQIKTGTGHDGSVIVGRIDQLERVSNGLGNAIGVFDTSPHACEAERLVREKFLRGVSADLDQFEGESMSEKAAAASEEGEPEDGPIVEKIVGPSITVNRARVMAATLVPRPAFQECYIELTDESEEAAVPDGEYTDTSVADEALIACAAIAASIPVEPPAEWFADPGLREPTPITVTDEGRVFGHIAAWHVDHIGLPFGTKPPRSRSNYAYFHTGVVRTVDGEDVPVGQLTLAGGHAPLEATAAAAVKHYDDTASAIADVHAGEDAYGIYVVGAVRPGTTPEQIRALRASAPSGDWRPINGRLEMVAVCQVNVPGFPLARARVASGHVMALVAAGAVQIAQLRGPSIDERIRLIETNLSMETRAKEARERVAALTAGQDEATLLSYIDTKTREEYAKKGWALSDGSFPIKDKKDLKNAIHAYGRAKESHKPEAKEHIKKRARALGAAKEIPESWLSIEEQMLALSTRVRGYDPTVREEAVARVASLRFRKREFDEEHHPRDDHGKFRHTIARLKDDLKGEAGTKAAIEALTEAEEADDEGDIYEAQRAVEKALDMVDKVAKDTVSADTFETLRGGYSALADALFKITQGQDQDAKMRFSDLPLPMRDLIDDLADRLSSEAKKETYEDLAGPLMSFKSGSDYMSMNEIRKHLSSIFRELLR